MLWWMLFGPPWHDPSGLMDPTVEEMLSVYAAALRQHQQHLEDCCDHDG